MNKKKLIDENGRVFGKVSIVDIIVVLAVVAVAAFFLSRKLGGSSAQTPGTPETASGTVELTILLPAAKPYIADAAAISTSLYSEDGGQLLGKITNVKSAPAQCRQTLPDGTPVMTTHPELLDVYVTVSVDAAMWTSAAYKLTQKEDYTSNPILRFNTKRVYVHEAILLSAKTAD
ncbi:MAG: DUF4330 domain-containing protein [Oscillospiraceae bacterium]|jgi:hypothetical protein|nr:DUF4330 domain-containing protein [Oscillospiraceae bacterium]